MSKLFPKSEQRAQMLKDVRTMTDISNRFFSVFYDLQFGVHEKEYWLYGIVLPEVAKIRASHNLKPLKVPTCYYADRESGTFIMENLKDSGYQLIKSKEDGKINI